MDMRNILPAALEGLSWLQAKLHRQHLGHRPAPEQDSTGFSLPDQAMSLALLAQNIIV